MTILSENLILSHNFEVEIIPGENTPNEVEARLIEVIYVSPIKSIFDPSEPDANSFVPLEIKRAIQNDTYFFDWTQNWQNGIQDKRSARVFLLKPVPSNSSSELPEFERLWSWKLVNCQPAAWEGPELDALQSTVACETIILNYSDLVWE